MCYLEWGRRENTHAWQLAFDVLMSHPTNSYWFYKRLKKHVRFYQDLLSVVLSPPYEMRGGFHHRVKLKRISGRFEDCGRMPRRDETRKKRS